MAATNDSPVFVWGHDLTIGKKLLLKSPFAYKRFSIFDSGGPRLTFLYYFDLISR